MSKPSRIARSILIRTAGEVLLPETPPDAEPLLVEALLDTLCEMLADAPGPADVD
jgi:hypothetical protein